MLTKAYIPYGGYYSSPFCRWQGKMQNENSIVLGAETSKRWLVEKGYDAGMFDYLYLGVTISLIHQFFSTLGSGLDGGRPCSRFYLEPGLYHRDNLCFSGSRRC